MANRVRSLAECAMCDGTCGEDTEETDLDLGAEEEEEEEEEVEEAFRQEGAPPASVDPDAPAAAARRENEHHRDTEKVVTQNKGSGLPSDFMGIPLDDLSRKQLIAFAEGLEEAAKALKTKVRLGLNDATKPVYMLTPEALLSTGAKPGGAGQEAALAKKRLILAVSNIVEPFNKVRDQLEELASDALAAAKILRTKATKENVGESVEAGGDAGIDESRQFFSKELASILGAKLEGNNVVVTGASKEEVSKKISAAYKSLINKNSTANTAYGWKHQPGAGTYTVILTPH